MNEMKIEDRLRREIAEYPRDVMIIVGAGVTQGAVHATECAPRSSWGGLIKHGLEHAKGLGLLERAEAETIASLLGHDRPELWIAAAELLSKALGAPHGGDFRAWLREAVEPFGRSVRDRSVLDALVELQRRGATLATVNYDDVLEVATGLRPVTWVNSSQVGRVLRRRENAIVHLHGHWEQPESVVLGTTSYAAVVGDLHARAVLESMRMMRTLVFVGHGAGLRDPNWASFLDWTADVFRGSELRHYRIVLESDMESLRDPDQQDRRIFAVPYPGTYANLGPFMQSLVPATSPIPVAEPTAVKRGDDPPVTRTVLLLANIGNKGYKTVTAEEVVKFAELPTLAETHEVKLTLNLANARARDWREVAAQLDALLVAAEHTAATSPEPVTFVIGGRAPLPVFAYLGYHSKRLNGRILLVNQFGARWDRIGPFSTAADLPPSRRVAFSPLPPKQEEQGPGKVGLFVGCSSEYKCTSLALQPIAEADGRQLGSLYQLNGNFDHRLTPLDQTDLRTLTTALAATLESIAVDHSNPSEVHGLILAVAGPTWVAFWLGRMLNTNVTSKIDFPNYVQGVGYRRALTSRTEEVRWVHGTPRVLALAAQPRDAGGIDIPGSLRALLESVGGESSPLQDDHVVTVSATKASDLVELFGQAQTDILHIYAHGSPTGNLGFEDGQGGVALVSPAQLVAAIESTDMRTSLAVVCACHGTTLVQPLLSVAEIVVATDERVQYEAAIEFTRKFYSALVDGASVAAAFDRATVHVDLTPGLSSEAFQLEHRPGVDPRDAVFWAPRS